MEFLYSGEILRILRNEVKLYRIYTKRGRLQPPSFCIIVAMNYACSIAPMGQASAQAPQSMHELGSIL